MNLNINKIWNINIAEQILGIAISKPIKNRENKILVYTKSGRIVLLSLDGKMLLDEQITKGTAIWNGLIDNIDDDDTDELILGGLDGLLRIFKCSENFELIPYWVHQFGSSISGIFIDDINGDGIREIIAYSLDKTIRILNPKNGNLLWGQIFEQGVTDAIFCKDKGKIELGEVIASSNDGTIRSFDPIKGNLLWFKRFENKVRTLSFIKMKQNYYLVCGGDDRKIHVLDYKTKNELKTFDLEDYIWKTISYPKKFPNYLIISTYSFDYFDKESIIENIEFTSEIVVLDSNLNIKWNLKNINSEIIDYIEVFGNKIILTGTTRGELLLINEIDGKIVVNINHDSCINDIKYLSGLNRLITCHDDGNINAYLLYND